MRYEHSGFWFRGLLSLLLISLVAFGVTACGSTRVVVAQKTIVHQGSIYNVSNVSQVRPSRSLVLPDGSVRDPQGLDDRTLRELFRQNDSLELRLHILLDETTLRYIDGRVTSASEVRRAERQFDRAMDRIQKFLGDRRQMQLQLK